MVSNNWFITYGLDNQVNTIKEAWVKDKSNINFYFKTDFIHNNDLIMSEDYETSPSSRRE